MKSPPVPVYLVKNLAEVKGSYCNFSKMERDH